MPFQVGDWRVDPAAGCIARDGLVVHLEPKVMDVLVCLAARPGAVVRREELDASVWRGAVVGYDAVSSAMLKLRKALRDNTPGPRYIDTVSKRGYRLVAPVRFALDLPPEPAGPDPEPMATASLAALRQDRYPARLAASYRAVAFFLAALLLTAFAALLWRAGAWFGGPPAGRPGSGTTIAVLPFENLDTDPAQQFFADGVSDDLITDLTKVSGWTVTARDSSFAYRKPEGDLRRVAEALGARYLLHGSVRRAGDRLRINAMLTDSGSGRQVWAERYEGGVAEVFELQDRITSGITSALSVTLSEVERRRLARRDTDNLPAYESFLKGEERFYRYARTSNGQARVYFQQAIAMDPQFSRALAMLAWTHTFDFMNGWSDDPQQSLLEGERLATRALEIDAELPVAYFVRGLVHRERGEYVKALVEAERALALDPSYANGHVLHATLLYYAGRPEEGLAGITKAIALNPIHPSNYPFHLGQAYFVLKRYDAAIAAFRQGLEQNPTSERLHVWLAASYAHSGQIDDAKWEMDQVQLANPQFSLHRIRGVFPFTDPQDLERFLHGLQLAGLSE